jgi:hypothetical protein
MRLPKDWREFIGSLNSDEVDYLIVGAFALAFHGFPCYTGGRLVPQMLQATGVKMIVRRP